MKRLSTLTILVLILFVAAGCGGGSVIDFMMKLRERNGEDGSFKETVLAMREMFLK